MIKISPISGIHMEFPNGWTLSAQWGPATYSDNYNMSMLPEGSQTIEERFLECARKGSSTFEVAFLMPDGDLYEHPDFDGDTVGHYVPLNQLIAYMLWIQEQ